MEQNEINRCEDCNVVLKDNSSVCSRCWDAACSSLDVDPESDRSICAVENDDEKYAAFTARLRHYQDVDPVPKDLPTFIEQNADIIVDLVNREIGEQEKD